MKPLTTITILSRDPMDRDTLHKVGVVTFESTGDGEVILTRDDMGVIQMEAASMKADDAFTRLLDETTQSLTALHAKLGELHMVTNQAMGDMFSIHKWLTR